MVITSARPGADTVQQLPVTGTDIGDRLAHSLRRVPDLPAGAPIGLALVGSCLGAASASVGVGGRAVPWPPEDVHLPWPAGDGAVQGVGLVGIGLVTLAWLLLGLGVLRGRTGVRAVLGLAAAATVPLALAPPLFSEDAWTYVGIGQLVDRGFDPYRVGWGVLGRADYAAHLGPFWRDTPSPYSPLALRLLQAIAHSVGGGLSAGVVELRVIALLALAASVPLLIALISARGRPAAPVVWLVVANPLLVVTLLSAAHLDVLVLPLLLAALLAHQRGHDVVAVLASSLAGQVKVTALVVAGFLIAARLLTERPGEASARRARAASGLAAVAAATFVAINLLCGLGFGWLRTLSIPDRANNVLTPLDALTDLASTFGIGRGPVSGQVVATAPPWLIAIGLTLAVLGTAALAWKVPELGVARASAYSLILLTLLNGAVWSWYFCVPFVLLALVGSRREQLVVAGLSTLLVFSIHTDGAGAGGVASGGLRAAALIGDVGFLGAYAIAAVLIVQGSRRSPAVIAVR